MLTEPEKAELLKMIERGKSPFKLDSAEKLHFFAEEYNWDYGTIAMRQLIHSKICDKATALMVYWKNAPRFLSQYAKAEDVPLYIELASYNLRFQIEEKYLAGFYKSGGSLKFDPFNDRGINWATSYDGLNLPNLRPIPPEMYIAV